MRKVFRKNGENRVLHSFVGNFSSGRRRVPRSRYKAPSSPRLNSTSSDKRSCAVSVQLHMVCIRIHLRRDNVAQSNPSDQTSGFNYSEKHYDYRFVFVNEFINTVSKIPSYLCNMVTHQNVNQGSEVSGMIARAAYAYGSSQMLQFALYTSFTLTANEISSSDKLLVEAS
jgi:hypothetical protein